MNETKQKYKAMSTEQEQAIKDVFSSYQVEKAEFTFATKEDGYYVSVCKMYEYVEFKHGISTLQGFQKIAEILECKDGDEVDRWSSGGCETCDYGSRYSYTLKFW